MAQILIVSNTPSVNTERLQQVVCEACADAELGNHLVSAKTPLDAGAEDVMDCDGIILGTTENFGYMSGVLKDFFERIYYPCLENTEGKPVGLYVKGGLDGEGARISVEKILTGLRWKMILPALVLRGEYQPDFEKQVRELGMTMAAGLEAGIY